MPKLNPYLIPKENLPKTEEIVYLDQGYQPRSYEEFMKTYELSGAAEVSYRDEINSQEKGYGPCSYSSYEVNPHKVAGKHIDMCGSLDCSYYRRITGNRAGGAIGTTASIGAGIGFWAALAATPFTGGASLAVAAGLSAAASVSAVGGTALTVVGMTETLNGIENELKRERNRNLQSQLNKLESDLRETTEKRDRCKRESDYMREQEKVEKLENQIKRIKRDLYD